MLREECRAIDFVFRLLTTNFYCNAVLELAPNNRELLI